MFSREEIMEILPDPIRIEIYCNECKDAFFVRKLFKKIFKEIIEKHNRNRDTKIENYSFSFFGEGNISVESINEYIAYKIYVGKQIIHEGSGLSAIDINENFNEEFYMSILSLIEGNLNTWHDEIIKVQKENDAKLKELEEEGYDELLYAYYHFNSDKKAFIYLKKLATRYPNSTYMKKLVRIYRLGRRGLHESKPKLWKKMDKSTKRAKHKDF